MKINILFSSVLLYAHASAQIQPGFSPKEAKDLILLCNSFTYIDLYGSDSSVIPSSCKKVYTSPTYGMDNKFQVYVQNGIGIINFRGSTDNKSSWLENFYSALIPVEDVIKVENGNFYYKVGKDTAGGVHAGYILALSHFQEDVLIQMKNLNQKGIYNFIITGHSQGGALAQVLRASLEYLPESKVSKKNKYKVYSFANPMIGNFEFAKEYNKNYSEKELSFSLHNPEDIVPQMPMSYNDSTYWKESALTLLGGDDAPSKKSMLLDGFIQTFENPIKKLSNVLAKNLNKQLEKDLGTIEMPKFKNDINYCHTGKLILLPPTEYPLELKDSMLLADRCLLATYVRNEEGEFEDPSVYKKSRKILQHKPYNYYTSVLKVYYPTEYASLDQKYFVMPIEQ